MEKNSDPGSWMKKIRIWNGKNSDQGCLSRIRNTWAGYLEQRALPRTGGAVQELRGGRGVSVRVLLPLCPRGGGSEDPRRRPGGPRARRSRIQAAHVQALPG
jgi:hypothetical protein